MLVLEQFPVVKPDLVLLDINMPGLNGFEVAEKIRENDRHVLIFFLSDRSDKNDRLKGFSLKGNDYLAKPFHTAELLARVKSVLRRSRSGGDMTVVSGNVSLDPESRRVSVAGRELSLLKKEYDILFYFMQRPGHLVDKTVLAEAVWGDHADQADSFHFLYAQVKNLRRKLAEAGASIEVKAVYGFGYKLVASESD